MKNLVILFRFADHVKRPLPSADDFDTIFNAPGGDPLLAPTGSVRDYYLENSYGSFSLESTVVGWVTLSRSEAYYADGVSGLSYRIFEAIYEALERIDPVVDFDDFDQNHDGAIDAISFVHSGYGAEFGDVDASGADFEDRIWSHQWELVEPWRSEENVRVSRYHLNAGLWGTYGRAPSRIGVLCHELAHFLGLPDLYDGDGGGEGIGSWGLMANSWGFDGEQLYPPHLSAWSKIRLGWVQPRVLREEGTYVAAQVESHPVVYRIETGYPSGEYLLIENRQPVGFESRMPQGGLCIWHIDEHADQDTEGHPGQYDWPENGNHYRVALLQADGRYDLERGDTGRGDAGDVYHAAGVSAIGIDTVPNTHAYQGGRVAATGVRIDEIGFSGAEMMFRFSVSGDGPGSENRELFRRGDADGTGGTNLADPIVTLEWLFISGPPPACPDAADTDDNGVVNLSDPIFTLSWLFVEGPPPPAPGQSCGRDPTPDLLGTCVQSACED